MELLHPYPEELTESPGITPQPHVVLHVHDPAEVAHQHRGTGSGGSSDVGGVPIRNRIQRAHQHQVVALQ
jgi:hypothetical protein